MYTDLSPFQLSGGFELGQVLGMVGRKEGREFVAYGCGNLVYYMIHCVCVCGDERCCDATKYVRRELDNGYYHVVPYMLDIGFEDGGQWRPDVVAAPTTVGGYPYASTWFVWTLVFIFSYYDLV